MNRLAIRKRERYFFRRTKRPLLAELSVLAGIASLLLLSGCAASQGVKLSSNARTVEASEALIIPSAGGPAVVGVVEKRHANAVEQKVALYTSSSVPGQNHLTVQMYGPMKPGDGNASSISYKQINPFDLRREMRQAVPGVAMRTSALFLQNGYGPFGYAYGRSTTGDGCIYAWQQLRSTEAERETFRHLGMIQIRLRFCDSAKSERELLWSMYNFTINGSFGDAGWNPYGEPPEVSAGIGSDGNPVYPKELDLPLAETRQTRPATRSVQRSQKTVTVETTRRAPVEERALPKIPSPSGDVQDDKPNKEETKRVLVPAPVCNEDEACD